MKGFGKILFSRLCFINSKSIYVLVTTNKELLFSSLIFLRLYFLPIFIDSVAGSLNSIAYGKTASLCLVVASLISLTTSSIVNILFPI